MDYKYVVRFIVTRDEYLYWLKHPIGKNAVKKGKLHTALCTVGIIIGVLLIVLGFIANVFWTALFGLAFTVIFGFRQFVLKSIVARQKYDMAIKLQKNGIWGQEYRFGDNVVITDGRNEAVYDYSDFKALTQNDKYFILWLDDDLVLRIPKNAFITGDANEFEAFANEKICNE